MVTELSPDCLSISGIQMLPNNGHTHVSQRVGIEYTKQIRVFGFKELSFSGALPGL